MKTIGTRISALLGLAALFLSWGAKAIEQSTPRYKIRISLSDKMEALSATKLQAIETLFDRVVLDEDRAQIASLLHINIDLPVDSKAKLPEVNLSEQAIRNSETYTELRDYFHSVRAANTPRKVLCVRNSGEVVPIEKLDREFGMPWNPVEFVRTPTHKISVGIETYSSTKPFVLNLDFIDEVFAKVVPFQFQEVARKRIRLFVASPRILQLSASGKDDVENLNMGSGQYLVSVPLVSESSKKSLFETSLREALTPPARQALARFVSKSGFPIEALRVTGLGDPFINDGWTSVQTLSNEINLRVQHNIDLTLNLDSIDELVDELVDPAQMAALRQTQISIVTKEFLHDIGGPLGYGDYYAPGTDIYVSNRIFEKSSDRNQAFLNFLRKYLSQVEINQASFCESKSPGPNLSPVCTGNAQMEKVSTPPILDVVGDGNRFDNFGGTDYRYFVLGLNNQRIRLPIYINFNRPVKINLSYIEKIVRHLEATKKLSPMFYLVPLRLAIVSKNDHVVSPYDDGSPKAASEGQSSFNFGKEFPVLFVNEALFQDGVSEALKADFEKIFARALSKKEEPKDSASKTSKSKDGKVDRKTLKKP